jgi:hypothetical protein
MKGQEQLGEGVTECPTCGLALVPLFRSLYCAKCESEEPPTAPYGPYSESSWFIIGEKVKY